MEDIVTKDKEQFFLSEMGHYRYKSIYIFKKSMIGMDATCKNCGVYYLEGCKKRCDCKELTTK